MCLPFSHYGMASERGGVRFRICPRSIGPGSVVEMEFGRRLRAPIVDFRTAGEPQSSVRRRAEQRLAERGFGLAERNRLQARAVITRNDHADMALAHHVGLDDAH